MKVLVACERSGRVRDAFRALGHDAMSCDIEATDVDGPHHQGDVLPLLRKRWDLVVAFPPCTDLAWSNGRYLPDKRADGRTSSALDFFGQCLGANAPRVCVENPKGDPCHAYPNFQVIQPWEWGDPWVKTTCLWLRGLPPLMPTFSGSEDEPGLWINTGAAPRENGRPGRVGAHRNSRQRSLTFPGIARAMAQQWGDQ